MQRFLVFIILLSTRVARGFVPRPLAGSAHLAIQNRLRHDEQIAGPLFEQKFTPTDSEESNKKKKRTSSRIANKKPQRKKNLSDDEKQKLVKAVGEQMKKTASSSPPASSSDLLDRINPFKAGQNLRKSIGKTLSSMQQKTAGSVYYIDDRVMERDSVAALSAQDYIPEILVVGASGGVGRLVVQRLLREGRCRVRVLVRDLYSNTLNLLGTQVTYCQGDLSNVDSLEYALTDVDKIVFCASAPSPDEEDFRQKFADFVQENQLDDAYIFSTDDAIADGDYEWDQLDSVRQVRAQLAEKVDCIGMANLVRAYQNVRHVDYGTSQAAKRILFKFNRQEDFNLFSVDDGSGETSMLMDDVPSIEKYSRFFDEIEDDDDDRGHYDDDYLESRDDATTKAQVQWLRNSFDRAVFVGRVPKASSPRLSGGESAVISTRLRSRDDPDNGIDLSSGFGGFVARVCSDGGTYEAFIRTKSYDDDGIEYVCEFRTQTKVPGPKTSSNKFTTVRLPFENFRPVKTAATSTRDTASIPVFRGKDVRYIGFRYRSASNHRAKKGDDMWDRFYLALSYVKLYRTQPEPEFVYLSDARIPPRIHDGMVRHQARQLVSVDGDDLQRGFPIFDESDLLVTTDKTTRSKEETYFKFRGEEILKNSGLSYAIVRVAGYDERASGEASTIDLHPDNKNVTLMSRDEVSHVCASALLDPNALNKSFYVSKKRKASSADEDMSRKFEALAPDTPV